MEKALFILLFLFSGILISPAQSIDALMLDENEIPDDYIESDQLSCVTPNAFALYDQSELYEKSLGRVVKKSFQTFQKKGDCGSVLYFEFASDFKAKAFLEELLWHKAGRPTKNEPDDYYAKGNILIIWSFPLESPMEMMSRAKVMRLMP
jgi:hypothetical protein